MTQEEGLPAEAIVETDEAAFISRRAENLTRLERFEKSLASRINFYWEEWGHKVRARAELVGSGIAQTWVVRSDLVNGLPVEISVEEKNRLVKLHQLPLNVLRMRPIRRGHSRQRKLP